MSGLVDPDAIGQSSDAGHDRLLHNMHIFAVQAARGLFVENVGVTPYNTTTYVHEAQLSVNNNVQKASGHVIESGIVQQATTQQKR